MTVRRALLLAALGALFVVFVRAASGVQDPEPVGGLPPVDWPQRPAPAPAPPARAPDAAPTPSPESPPAFDYAGRASQAAFEAELRRLVRAHPTRLGVVSLGKSRGGRDLWLLVAGERSAGEPDRRPALLVASSLEPVGEARPIGPEAALYALRALLERADSDAGSAAWLARATVYVLAAPDPDPLFAPEGAPPRACRLDRNFPAEWRPWSSASCAQGPYPLSEPETQAAARALASRSNVGAVLLLERASARAPESVEPTEWERILCRRLAPAAAEAATDGDRIARVAASAVREPGSFAAFCRARLDAFVWPCDPFVGDLVDTPFGRAPAGFGALLPRIEALARELPALDCALVKTERLRERLWLVDVDVSNQGLLPTVGAAERERCSDSVWLESTGGRVTQVGVARAGAAARNAEERKPGSWTLGHLEGRENVRLHVVVEAPEGTQISFAFRTLREGQTRCGTTLH